MEALKTMAKPQKPVEETALALVNADVLARDFAWSRRALARLAWRLAATDDTDGAAEIAEMVAKLDTMRESREAGSLVE